jgi:hypothetical protein
MLKSGFDIRLLPAMLLVALAFSACALEDDDPPAPPQAQADAYSTDQDVPLSISAALGLLANDFGIGLSCDAGTYPTNQGGSVDLASDGSFDYTPPAAFAGLDAFSYTVRNGGGSDVGSVSITVVPTVPQANDDAFFALFNTQLNEAAPGILGNDLLNGGTITDPALDPLTSATAQGGTLTLRADGSFDYDPPVGFTGDDTFTYELTNTFGSDTATVTITVRRLPVADPDNYSTPVNTPLNVNAASGLLDNDEVGFPVATLTAFGGGSLGGTVTTNAAGAVVTFGAGSLTVLADGSFDFTPDTGFTGVFSFNYRLTNAAGSSDALVEIGVPQAPTATADSFAATTAALLQDDVLANDGRGFPLADVVSFGGGSLGGTVDTNSAGSTVNFGTGSLTVNADGSFDFTSDTGFTGAFTFDYRITNTEGTDTATVSIDVQLAPIADDDSYTTLINTPLSINAAAGVLDNDMSGPAMQVTSFGGGSLGGAVTDNAAGATVTFGAGSLTLNADGSFDFTPDTGVIGNFTFDYRISNGFGEDEATVTIAVRQAPTAASDPSYTAVTGTPLNEPAPGVLGNDAVGFPPATVLSFGGGTLGGAITDHNAGATANFTGGSLTLNADGSFDFDTTTFSGVFTFDYRISNVLGTSDATVTIDVSQSPVAVNDSYDTAPGVPISRTAGDPDDLLDNDTLGLPAAVLASFGGLDLGGDVTSNAAGATITPLPGFGDGSLTVGADGSFAFTPATGQTGLFQFEYRITNTVGSDEATVTIALEQAPSFTSANNTTLTVGTTGSFDITATGTPQTMTISITNGTLPASLVFNDNGDGTADFSGTPAANDGGEYILEFTANNGVGTPAVQNFTLTINEPAGITSANNTTFTVGSAGSFTVTTIGFPFAAIARTGDALPTGVTFTDNADGTGTLSGTAAAGEGGVYNLIFTPSNTLGTGTAQNFTLTVNEAPTANPDDPGAAYTIVLGNTLNINAASGVLANDSLGFPAAALASFGPSTGIETSAGNAGSTSGGTGLTANADGSFSYTPVASGVHTFVYTLTNTAGSDTATVTITVNAPPTAANDPTGGIPGASTPGSTPFHITMNGSIVAGSSPNLMANDNRGFPLADVVSFGPTTGAETTVASATNGSTQQGGTVRVFADGSFNYNPPSATFTGLDSFAYRILNAGGNSTATVNLAVGVRPAATGETYTPTVLGNIPVNTNTGTTFSVLTNDTGDQLAANHVSTSSGTTSFNANGTFTYTPARGFSGAVTVTYNVSNGFGASSNVTLAVPVGTPVWFINNTLGAAGDGTFNTPYNTLALFATANGLGTAGNPANGDRIFVFSSGTAYTGSLTLRNTQRLIGQSTSLTFNVATGLTLPAHSTAIATNTGTVTLNSAITLGSDNHLYGFAMGAAAGVSISGSNFGTLNSSGVTINNTSGAALSLTTGALNAITFSTVTSTGGTTGIELSGVTGSLTISGGAISGASTTGVRVNGGTATLSFACAVSKTSAGRLIIVESRTAGTASFSGNLSSTGTSTGILVQNNTGGTVNFSAGTKTVTTGANAGVTLTSNTGATINFTGGGLAVTTTSGAGFAATGGGTVTVQGANNTITSTTGTALNIASTTIGGSGVTFRSISANGAASGIVLNNTGSVGLTVTGDGTNNFSGGTIQNCTGHGILLNTTSNTSLTSIRIQNITAAGASGVFFNTVTDFSLVNSTLNNIGNLTPFPSDGHGIAGASNTGATFTQDNISGNLTISGCTFTSMINRAVDIAQYAVGRNLNSVNISDNTFTGAGSHVISFGLPATVSANSVTFNNNNITANNGFGSSGIIVGLGAGLSATDAPTATVTMTNNTVTNCDGVCLMAFVRNSNGVLHIKIQNNNVTAPLTGFRTGIRVDSGNSTGNATVFLNIANNTTAGNNNQPGIGLRKQGTVATTNTFGIQGMTPATATASQMEDYVSTQNPASGLGNAADGFTQKRCLAINGDNFVTTNAVP